MGINKAAVGAAIIVGTLALAGCTAAVTPVVAKPTPTHTAEQTTTIEDVWKTVACDEPDAMAVTDPASGDIADETKTGSCTPAGGTGVVYFYEFKTHDAAAAGVEKIEPSGTVYVFENIIMLTEDPAAKALLDMRYDEVAY